MKFRAPIASIIYVGSYLPLGLILLVQDIRFDLVEQPLCSSLVNFSKSCERPLSHPGIALGVFLGSLLCFCLLLLSLAIVKPKIEVKIQSAKHVPADLMNYTLPYVVSFMGIDYSDPGKISGFLIFLTWIFLISYRSGQVILNPLLIVFGWRLYDVEYSYSTDVKTYSGICLSKVVLTPEQTYRRHQIEDVLIIKG